MMVMSAVGLQQRWWRKRRRRENIIWWMMMMVLFATFTTLQRTWAGIASDQQQREDFRLSDNPEQRLLRDEIPTSTTTTNDDDSNDECICLGATTANQNNSEHEHNVGARILYLITVHNQRTLDDAVYLFRAIRDARNMILIHVDTKLDMQQVYYSSQLYQEITSCSCGALVLVESLYDCQWGQWSMNLPTLWAMQVGLQQQQQQQQQQYRFDVFINLSGDTMAVVTPNTMAQLWAGPLAGINFCTSSACETGLRPTHILEFPSFWHKRIHYDDGKPMVLEHTTTTSTTTTTTTTSTNTSNDNNDTISTTLHIHFGSQWMSLTREFCQWVVHSLQYHPTSLPSRFRDYLIQRGFLMTDETFFATLLAHVFPETLPPVHPTTGTLQVTMPSSKTTTASSQKDLLWAYHAVSTMSAIRYERMDEHIPTAIHQYFPTQQRYQVPQERLGDSHENNSSIHNAMVDVPKIWGPYYLGVYDLWDIRQSGALFCRKVSSLVDENMMTVLPVDHPNHIPPIQWPLHGVAVSDMPDWERQRAKLTEYAKEQEAKQMQQQQQQQQQNVNKGGQEPLKDSASTSQQHSVSMDDVTATDL